MPDERTGSSDCSDAPPLVYCGCIDGPGHMLWSPGGKRRPRSAEGQGAGPWRYLDSPKLNPGGRHGSAKMTHEDGWTALGITDYSVDSRPGSHATFAVEGLYGFADMLALIWRDFPAVLDRIRTHGEVWLVDGPTVPPTSSDHYLPQQEQP